MENSGKVKFSMLRLFKSITGTRAGARVVPRALAAIGLVLSGLLPPDLAAQQSLQDALRDFRIGEFWIYDDWDAARKLAEKEKRPIFCVFRCVP